MSVTISFTVTDDALKDAVSVAEDWYGLRLTPDQMGEMLKTQPLAAFEVMDGLDTLGRERLIDAIVEYVGMPAGSAWPINMDGPAKRAAFYPTFAEKCKAKGYEVLWTVEEMVG